MSKTLWAVNFNSNRRDFGSGVITLDGSQAYGGDHGYYYLGNCTISGNSVSASVTVTKHNPSVESVFGNFTTFNLVLTGNGSVDAGQISLSGHVKENPQMTLNAVMRKLANLG